LNLKYSINGFALASVVMMSVTSAKSEEGNANPEVVRNQSLALSGVPGLSELFDISGIGGR
jgi:hypothetical protein